MNLSVLRRTAAEIAAAAATELYPNVELLGGGDTSTGFSYDFYVPHPLDAHLIEEKMRQIAREKRPIRTLEMIAFSAGELLKKEGHVDRAKELPEGLVEVIQIGPFHDLSPGPHLKNTAELAAFKISIESLPNQRTRIVGWCHHSKKELNQFLKKLHHYTEPRQIGEQKGLWKGAIWLAEGLQKRQQLIHFLKQHWFSDAFEISGPLQVDRTELHRSMGQPKVAEIRASSPWETEVQISFFALSEEEVISCLQSIGETLTILGFDHSTVPRGRETDYVVKDGLERSYPVVRVKRISKKGSSAEDLTFTAEVERMLFLLLENKVELENQ